MNENEETVYIVDDDSDARDSLEALVGSMGLRCEAFVSAEDFLWRFQASWQGCAVIDMRLPEMSGLELHERLVETECRLPVVMISGHATVAAAVQAMQNGAVTFIEKPYCSDDLCDAIRRALAVARTQRLERAKSERFQQRLQTLTPREKTVMREVLADKPNRTIARDLSVSLRTAARLRAAVFEKLDVVSATDLARLVAEKEGGQPPFVHRQHDDESSFGSA